MSRLLRDGRALVDSFDPRRREELGLVGKRRRRRAVLLVNLVDCGIQLFWQTLEPEGRQALLDLLGRRRPRDDARVVPALREKKQS